MGEPKSLRPLWTLYWTLAALPLITTCLAFPLLSDQVPMHYDLSGEINRWGSKAEEFILPGITIGFALLMWALIRFAQSNPPMPPRPRVQMVCASLVTLNAMSAVFLAISLSHSQGLTPHVDVSRTVGTLDGVALTICGNLMPLIRQNGWSGIRVPGVTSPESWARLQRFGGRMFMTLGLILTLACLFVLHQGTALIGMILADAAALIAVLIRGRQLAASDRRTAPPSASHPS